MCVSCLCVRTNCSFFFVNIKVFFLFICNKDCSLNIILQRKEAAYINQLRFSLNFFLTWLFCIF